MSAKIRTILVVLGLVLFLFIFVAPIVFSTTAIAPMLSMPVQISRSGHPLPASELASVQYAFDEKSTAEIQRSPPSLKDAHVCQGGYYLILAPFVISRDSMFSAWTTSPQYRSLTLRLTLRNGSSLSLVYPVVSDTKLNTPICIDLPN